MAVGAAVPWDTCEATACTGARLGTGAWCLVHLPAEGLAGRLTAGPHGVDLDGRGACFTRTSLARVLEQVPVDDAGRRRLGTVRFDQATFEAAVSFDDADFAGAVSFAGATFSGDARFGGATFAGPVDCRGTSFGGQAWFVGASFAGRVSFVSARFAGPAWFQHAGFAGPAAFDGATFAANLTISDATFAGGSSFTNAAFEGHLRLDRASCADGWQFDHARFKFESEGPSHQIRPPADTVVQPVFARDAKLRGDTTVGGRRGRRGRKARRSGGWEQGEPSRNPRLSVVLAVVVIVAGGYIMFRPTGTASGPEDDLGPGRTAYLHKDGAGAVTRYNPCVPLRYVVNDKDAPEGWKAALDDAVAELAKGTSMPMQFAGIMAEPVAADLRGQLAQAYTWPSDVDGYSQAYQKLFRRPSYQPSRYGSGIWAPVLIAWAPFGRAGAGYRHSPDAVGASDVRQFQGRVAYVSGTIVLNSDVASPNLKATFLHQLGHVLGLGHVGPSQEVMHPMERTQQQWGEGDLSGLKIVAPAGQCVETPAPGA